MNAWANLDLLGQPNAFLVQALAALRSVESTFSAGLGILVVGFPMRWATECQVRPYLVIL
jgi:hypothetical protein